jgi:uncharacterized membrane protein YhaH (DUF805 family)
MRLERGRFWRLVAVNLLVTAVVVALLPPAIGLPQPSYNGMPLPPVPLWSVSAFLLCLPVGWIGAWRLHDVGQPGWHAWLPLAAFACATFVPSLMLPLLLKLVIEAQAAPIQARQIAPAIMIGLWLGALVVAAGTLRTVFLWLQPGDLQDNRYGPAPVGAAAPKTDNRIAAWPSGGRMRRLPFWLLVAVNVMLVYAVMHGLRHALNHWATNVHWWPKDGLFFGPIEDWIDFVAPGFRPALTKSLSWISLILYLPSLYAAVLRLHDRNQSGILSLVVLVVSIAATFAERLTSASQTSLMNAGVDIVTIYLLFQCMQPGDPDDNRFGPPPGEQPVPHLPVPEIPRKPSPAPRQEPAARQGFGRRGQ